MATARSGDGVFGLRVELVVAEVLGSILEVCFVLFVTVVIILGVIQTLSLVLVIPLLGKCQASIS